MVFVRLRPKFLSASLALIFATNLAAQTKSTAPQNDARIGALLDQLGRIRTPMEAAISPDGKTVAWSVHSSSRYELHLSDTANPDPAKDRVIKPATGVNCSNDAPVWSPDGGTLAYAS